ncbi:MAG: heme ABC exporter ATP-binding protein CcmA [Rhizobiaceae bacterium]|nr:heme ABC exporter ATP-binding protein CcmA [Rhizobiaceae bacterium]
MKLTINNLSGERNGQMIFSNISFTLAKGEALIITGTNGSGKSTLLRVIAGLLPAASGTVSLEDSGEFTPPEMMHYLGHLNALKPAMSIEENLIFWQQFCGNSLLDPDAALEAVALPGIGHLPAAYLSAGQKRRISIAKLLVSFKPVWIVDEPTGALDKASEQMFARLVNEHLNNGGIAIAATHKPLDIGEGVALKTKSMNMDEMPVEDTLTYGDLL